MQTHTYIYIYIYTRICVIYKNATIRTHMCVYIYIYIIYIYPHMHECICNSVHRHVYIYIYIYVCVCVCMQIYNYICVWKYIFMCICIFISMYTKDILVDFNVSTINRFGLFWCSYLAYDFKPAIDFYTCPHIAHAFWWADVVTGTNNSAFTFLINWDVEDGYRQTSRWLGGIWLSHPW